MLFLLLVAVVVPTACVLWFMSAAMRNERLAVRQKLMDAYRPQLTAAQGRLETYWKDKAASLAQARSGAAAAQVFAGLVRADACDSVLIHDTSGELVYPASAQLPVADRTPQGEWRVARNLEYGRADPVAAAAVYAKLADRAADVDIAARALQGQARCLAKGGQRDAALAILTRTLSDPRYRAARDGQGRFIAANAQLLALELIRDPADADYRAALDCLLERLTNYDDPVLPSTQRRFLMRRVQEVVPDSPPFPTLAAEELAARYVEAGASPLKASRFSLTRLPGVWQLTSPDQTVVALFTEDRIIAEGQSFVAAQISAAGVTARLLLPGHERTGPAPFIVMPAGDCLPDWQLALYLQGTDPFAVAAERQIAAYLWTGLLVILVIAIITLLVGRYVFGQIRLTRLKNDFIATVSHELKTPLSSMRVLVDTLLEGNYRDQQQVREYLQLVAKENLRLSRLIDNFLTFSRMERRKVAFEFAEVRPADIVTEAVESVRDRFRSGGCTLDVEVAPDLPPINGDPDALVTVVLNLLDNAYKYSQDDRHITLRAYAADRSVCLEVEDNGVGLSRRAARKVFDRFYQVDRSLSRSAGGCGLGLSIVRFIVDAHDGSIDVSSQPGNGSTFTVRLPAASVEADQA